MHALAGVNVAFERGRFTAVMGPSGSGKSTLMHCMAGLDRPTSGQTFVGEQDIGSLDDAGLTQLRRDRIGFVFQSFNLVPTLTAAENITLPADLAGAEGRPGVVRLPGGTAGYRRPADPPPQRAVRRPAAACGVRPGPDQQAGPGLRRRAHRQPGLQCLRGDAGVPAALGDRARPVDRDGDPRPAWGRVRRPGRLPGRREPWWANSTSRPPTRSWSRCGPWAPDMWNVTLKGLLAHKLRLALTALAIVLGVTFISGTFVLTDTLHNTFTALFGNIYQNIDFQVRGVGRSSAPRRERDAATSCPSRCWPRSAASPASQAADGEVEGYAQFVAPRRQGDPDRWRADPRRRLRPGSSRSPTCTSSQGGPPTTSHDVVMDAGTAQKYDFAVGQQVRILFAGPPRTFTITGIAQFGSADNLAGATLAAFTLPTAQAVLRRSGSSTTSTSWPPRAPTRPRSSGTSPGSCRPASRSSPGRPWPNEQHELGQPGAVVLLHRPAGLRVHLAVRRRRSPSSTRSRSSSGSGPGSWPCCGSSGRAAARCSARCSARRPSSGSSPR